MCKWLVFAAFSLGAVPVSAQTQEDAAHRADRLTTQQLNRDVAAAVARRDGTVTPADAAAYRAARARYDRAMAAWRRRLADCQNGDWSACDH